ncbi:G/U mismatch-specific DNA glycosylase [Metabacillus sp. RGM 3146]|uniref:G/U mismatch-specific DNA glycosylase n=1 Tax=Metabacillus sp. RGM 3146 TaxID=3401092 RepID=UPI003B9A2F83
MYPNLDLLEKNLSLLFVGYNPSIVTAETGHHYANPTNRFWKILYLSGITDRLYSPQEDYKLLQEGIGFTNIVERPTKAASEITKEEYKLGRMELIKKIRLYKPKIVCFVGKGVYLHYSGKREANWGKQPDSLIEGVIEFAAPSSSGLVRMKLDQITNIYKEVHDYM